MFTGWRERKRTKVPPRYMKSSQRAAMDVHRALVPQKLAPQHHRPPQAPALQGRRIIQNPPGLSKELERSIQREHGNTPKKTEFSTRNHQALPFMEVLPLAMLSPQVSRGNPLGLAKARRPAEHGSIKQKAPPLSPACPQVSRGLPEPPKRSWRLPVAKQCSVHPKHGAQLHLIEASSTTLQVASLLRVRVRNCPEIPFVSVVWPLGLLADRFFSLAVPKLQQVYSMQRLEAAEGNQTEAHCEGAEVGRRGCTCSHVRASKVHRV